MTKHKHYDVIVAYANGEEIQFRGPSGDWRDWLGGSFPPFRETSRYRVKPRPKEIVWWAIVQEDGSSKYAAQSERAAKNLAADVEGTVVKLTGTYEPK